MANPSNSMFRFGAVSGGDPSLLAPGVSGGGSTGFYTAMLGLTGGFKIASTFFDTLDRERAAKISLQEQANDAARGVKLVEREIEGNKFDTNKAQQNEILAWRLEHGKIKAGGGSTDINVGSNLALVKTADAMRASKQDIITISGLRRKDYLEEKKIQLGTAKDRFQTAANRINPVGASLLGGIGAFLDVASVFTSKIRIRG